MAKLTTGRKVQVIGALVEGSSIRSVERMTGVYRNTIGRLLLRVGKGCQRILDDEIRHVRCERLELDEVWAFVGKKKAQLQKTDDTSLVGDFWTWVAIDPDSKLVPHHLVSKRDMFAAQDFTQELAKKVEGRVQISTDKLAAYRHAIHAAWGQDVDYGRIVKRFAGGALDSGRYSPPKVVAVEREVWSGAPDVEKISTSIVERSHLTMRMGIRRMTRLTNGFSKRVESLRAAVALHFAHYNLVRRHSTIKTTPAVAAGVADRAWKIPELVEWAEAYGSQ